MKLLTIAALFFPFAWTAWADQAATLTCTGTNIRLVEKSPYLGEGSPYQQNLFVLISPQQEGNESAHTAYFLNIEYDVGKFGEIHISGTNEVGGRFHLITSFPQDESDGTVIRETSKGTLSYHHGPLKGEEEAVFCVRE